MEWKVKNALNRDVEREHLNKILRDIRSTLDDVTTNSTSVPPAVQPPPAPSRVPTTITLVGDVEGSATGVGTLTIETTLVNPNTGVEEAPVDGQAYWREGESWQPVPFPVQYFYDSLSEGLVSLGTSGVLVNVAVEGKDGEIEVENGEGVDTNIVLSLADVPNAGGGVLQKTAFDSKGRRTGTSTATTTDLPEGDNLYFSTERAYDSLKDILEAGANVILTEDDLSQTITITATGGGGGGTGSVDTVNSGVGIQVNNTDPSNPVINLQPAVATRIANAVVPSIAATDGDILEYEATTSNWVPKKNPRELYLDGGNF